ncbi:hypothetical protein AVEN_50480-1 [Araneus ventricosus]|uniref:Uncharacterized protein n=1 Tax=Araneus ventricosus TaxID=182803 RepID=A0A4Y2AQ48_ARAVE|nr:hypothetical protein AVEN_50480-1 [Araneus ventricosus]
MLVGRLSPGLTPFFGKPGQCRYFAPHQRDDVWLPTYDLSRNRPNTRRIFNGIGFRTWNSQAPRPRPYQQATAAICKGYKDGDEEYENEDDTHIKNITWKSTRGFTDFHKISRLCSSMSAHDVMKFHMGEL